MSQRQKYRAWRAAHTWDPSQNSAGASVAQADEREKKVEESRGASDHGIMYHHHSHDYIIMSVILLLPLFIMIALIPSGGGAAAAAFLYRQMTHPPGRWNPFATTTTIPYHYYRTFHPSFRLYGRQRPPKVGNDDDGDDEDDPNRSQTNKGSSSNNNSNNKTMKKENFPSKICVVCQRPFTWRKKWERSWDEITTCSKKCNGERRRNN